MGQCTGCLKYILFIFNFAMWLLGCALLSVGIWMKMDDSAQHHVERMNEVVDEEYQISYSAIGGDDLTVTIAYLLIVFGIILIIVTFIGCCGAVRENTCMLIAFAVCLFVLMIALLGVGVWAYLKSDDVDAHTDDLRQTTDQNIHRAIRKYHDDEVSEGFMDAIQGKFRCCGGRKAEDDYGSKALVPLSCNEDTYKIGCSYPYFKYVGQEIEDFLEDRYKIIAGVSLGVAVCLALGLVFTLLLCCIVRKTTVITVN
ncbi:CD9 antigen [Aplysia californica]|uniref:Tetraspanin n=1 Tax=Aplysia californica TaxID=6500 RepID=A0ABM0ZZT2_APLCA|nr:CD9 antigen [Aplysia californica]